MAKGKFLINTLKKSDEKDGITLVCTFSRKIFVPFFFQAFRQLILPPEPIHLIIYDNTDDETLKDALMKEVNPLEVPCMSQFASVRFYKSYLKGHGNIMGSGNEQFRKSKLWNIWRMWLSMKRMIKTPEMFVLEDDTICQPDAFLRLLGLLRKNSKVGFVTAIETGRFSNPWLPVRLGVHHMKMKGQKILARHSLSPDTKGVVPIDAAGVYCFAAKTKAYLDGFDGYNPISLKVPFFALDNVLTWNIKQHGWKVLADFSQWCSHLQATPTRIIAFSHDQAVQMSDIWIKECNNYAHGVEVLSRHHRARKFRVKKIAPSWELEPSEKCTSTNASTAASL